MSKKTYWFYLESYVHVFIKKNDLLLYNSISGDILEYKNNPVITRFTKRLKSGNNLLTLKITGDFLNRNQVILKYINEIKDNFMGDIIDVSIVKDRPFQMMPILSMQKDIKRLKKEPSRSIGESLLRYLYEISIYINNECSINCRNCADTYKQFLFCHKNSVKRELGISEIKMLLEEVRESSLSQINILGGDIFKYSKFNELVSILKNLSVSVIYHTHYKNLDGKNCSDSIIKPLKNLNVFIDFPVDEEMFKSTLEWLKKKRMKTKFIFLIQIEDEIKKSEVLIERNKMKNAFLIPYFNGNNLTLFKKHVFIKSKEMVLGAKPSSKDIFSRMVINPINFGKIFIKSNGNIHANLNFPGIGKIAKDSLYDVLYKEMYYGKSWRRLRSKLSPCKSCLFELLCPPPSNYEFAIGKNNLCNINI